MYKEQKANISGDKTPAICESEFGSIIDENTAYAQQVGINSTPTIILPDNRVIPGYLPADTLRSAINEN